MTPHWERSPDAPVLDEPLLMDAVLRPHRSFSLKAFKLMLLAVIAVNVAVAIFFYFVEFIADKIPAFDTVWDTFQTFVRVPAGAILAFAAVGAVSPELKLLATLGGGAMVRLCNVTMRDKFATSATNEPTSW